MTCKNPACQNTFPPRQGQQYCCPGCRHRESKQTRAEYLADVQQSQRNKDIRKLHKRGTWSLGALAGLYNISRSRIAEILRGK